MDFEQSIMALQDIVRKMEDKTIPLDDSLALMKDGVELSKSCINKLRETKGKVILLMEELGELVETEFDAFSEK